jgi:hypothetical protein
MKMALLGAAVVGFAVLFFLVAFVQFTREAMRSRKKPRHLIRITPERPTAKVFTLREPPVLPKAILADDKANGVAIVAPFNATIKHGPAKGSW